MAGPLRHLGELARARARRARSEHATTARRWPSWRRGRCSCRPGSRSNGWASPATGSRYEGKTLFIDPYLSRVPLARPAAAPPGAARPGGARPLRPRARRGRRRARRPHPLRPRRRRPGDRPPLRLQGLRLGLAGQPDGPARPGRADGRGRALPDLRARPVRGQLHAQRPLEAAARPRRPLRRRTDLRAPRRALPERLPLRPGLGDLDRGRRAALLPPGQRQPDRRRDPRARRRRLPRRRRRPRLHRRLLAADPARARPARRRPHPLRQLLPPARPAPGVRLQRELARAARGDRRGQRATIEIAALPARRPRGR